MRTVSPAHTCPHCANYRATGAPMEFDQIEPCYECMGNGYHHCPDCNGHGILRTLTNICPICDTDTSKPMVDDVVLDGDEYDRILAEEYGMSRTPYIEVDEDEVQEMVDAASRLREEWAQREDIDVWDGRTSNMGVDVSSMWMDNSAHPPAHDSTRISLTVSGAWKLLDLMGAEVLQEADEEGNITLVASRGRDLHIAHSKLDTLPALLHLISEMNNEDATALGF